MKTTFIYLSVFAALVLSSCSVDLNGTKGFDGLSLGSKEQIIANDQLAEEARKLSNFDGLDISSAITVNVTEGNYDGIVKVSAPDNAMKQIITKVDKGILKVYIDGSIKMSSGQKIVVSIPHNKLRSFSVSGASAVTVKHQLKVESMTVNLSGASAIDLNVLTNEFRSVNSGASKLKIVGNVQKVNLDVSGASKASAEGLKSSKVVVDASGASNVKVWAVDELKVSASGASKVEYKTQNNLQKILNKSGASKISEI